MSARREKRLRALERRVEALETIAATPVFIHTQGDGKEDYVLEAVRTAFGCSWAFCSRRRLMASSELRRVRYGQVYCRSAGAD